MIQSQCSANQLGSMAIRRSQDLPPPLRGGRGTEEGSNSRSGLREPRPRIISTVKNHGSNAPWLLTEKQLLRVEPEILYKSNTEKPEKSINYTNNISDFLKVLGAPVYLWSSAPRSRGTMLAWR